MKKHLYLVLIFFSFSGLVLGSKRYASPNGSASNSGDSPSSPWNLTFAIGSSSSLAPGDSLILMDGIYEGNFTSTVNGASNNPIYILPANEGKAIIDLSKNRTSGVGITLEGNYTWIIGIHVTSSTLIRKEEALDEFTGVQYESGIVNFGDNNRIINCWVYDVVGGGLSLWRSGLNLEVYGSIIFNNGSQSELVGTGHGMYIQHDRPDQPKIIENNFVFQNAVRGINIYTTNPKNGGVIVSRNVSFNTGVISTFDQSLYRAFHNFVISSRNNESFEITVDSNIFYSDLQGGRLNPDLINNVALGRNDPVTRDIKFRENILFGGGNMVELKPINSLTFQGNKLFNAHDNFFAFFGNSSSFPNSTWDQNTYRNIANNPKPFQQLSFSEWTTDFSPFDKGSSYSTSPPTSREVLVTQNKYDPLRFHVSILNFSDSELIEIDFSEYEEFKGSEYEIRDVQNPFDPNQKVKGTFEGNSISFPMNWTKSLQPKGNMPFQVVHTDSTFGTFLLVFKKKENEPVDFPVVKDSISIFLNIEGKVLLTSQDFLVEQPSEPFVYSSSKGFDFDCSDLGKNELLITLKNSRTSEEKTVPIDVWIVDNLPPDFEATDANLPFDKTVGKVQLDPGSFYIREEFIYENCLVPGGVTIDLSKTEITCADFKPDGTYEPIDVSITLTDRSGNSTTKVRKVNLNVFESDKVSVTPTEAVNGQPLTITLGDELKFTVKYWVRSYNGETTNLLNQTGKSLFATLPGIYFAVLDLDGGCEVRSEEVFLAIEAQEWPTPKSEVKLILNESGTAILAPQDLFDSWPVEPEGIVFDLSKREFSCDNIGNNEVKLTLKKSDGQSKIFTINVLVEDSTPPILITKIPELAFDLIKGELVLNPEIFVSSLKDNCGIKSLELSKTKITCDDYDSPLELVLTAVDLSGNITSEVLTISVSHFESKKISISPESGSEFFAGKAAEIRLGEEFGFTLLGWYRNGQLIQGEKGKAILTEESGTYWATLVSNDGGCEVESQRTEITFNALPYGEVKESITLILGPDGKADLGVADVFVSWPLSDPTLEISLSKTNFSCENIGESEVGIVIKNQAGQTWNESVKVIVKDQTSPVLVTKNTSFSLDVTKGFLEITPEMLLVEFGDNCGIKSLTLSKNKFTCEDLGKEFSIEIRAEDSSGNVKEVVSQVKIDRQEAEQVNISGSSTFCAGESGVLELSSPYAFEVVRWRRNGSEIQGQTGKTLEVVESGVYHAVIRYDGGCLSETKEFEVKVNPLPVGEIEVDGNILTAPEGDYTYQWFRNGAKLEGETSRMFTAELMGEYFVELASLAGCKANLEAVTLTISGLFNRPVNVAKDLKIYPNPASDRVILELPDGVLSEKPSILLYASDGKEVTNSVQMTVLNGTEVDILVNRLAKGTYLIWVIAQNQETYLGKLIILN